MSRARMRESFAQAKALQIGSLSVFPPVVSALEVVPETAWSRLVS
jgi:hypothetical protein